MATLEELQVAVTMDADGLGQDAERAAGNVESALGGIGAAAAGAAVGMLFSTALEGALDISSVTTSLEGELGLTAEQAEQAGRNVSEVFAKGFGESAEDVKSALVAVKGSLSDMAKASDADLQGMTKQALALAKTFEFDVAEAAHAGGNLLKLGLVGSSQEAFDLMTVAAQRMGPKLREEIPALTSEYAEFFDQMGFTGPQMFGLLAQAAQNPAFELDKLGDAFKEFTLRMADTDAVKEPLKELGLNVTKIQGLMNAGKGTEAFDQITRALKGVQDQTERTAIQAALFGGPGEDLGNNLLKLNASGAAAASGMDKAAGAAQKLTTGMETSPAQQWDSIVRTLSTTLGEMLAPALKIVSEFLTEHPEAIQAVTPVVLALATALAVWAAAQWILNSALLANPVTWIILGIVALVAAIVVIATKTTWFQDMWKGAMAGISAAWDWLWGILKAGWDLLVNLFMNWTGPGLIIQHWDTIRNAFSSAMSWISGVVRGGIDLITGWFNGLASLPGKVTSWFSDIGGKIAAPFKAGFNSVAGFWNSTIGGFSFSIPSWVPVVGGKSWSIPDIPMLAKGGLVPSTPGGTLALIGEGSEAEAVMPLSRLDGMLRSVAGTVARTGDAPPARVVVDITGGDDALKRVIQSWVRVDGGGNVQLALGQ